MIRVAFDVQIADVSRAGIGQFTSELLKHLERQSSLTVIPLRPKKRQDFSVPKRIWWDQVETPRMAARAGADVLLKSGFSTPMRSRVPVVTVLHDFAAKRFPEQLHRPSAWLYGTFAPWTARFARKVVTISDFTKREAMEFLSLPERQLITILQGGDPRMSPDPASGDEAILKRFELPKKFLLHLGTIEPRKNLVFLTHVFSQFHQRHPEYVLVLAGNPGWKSDNLHALVDALQLHHVVKFIGGVTDDEKRALLRRARVLVFPSRYEGFGLPPLEAMRSGTSVVASRSSSIPEVVGDAGILVDGYDEPAWVSALERAAEDDVTRARLQTAGRERAAHFSWDQAAQQFSDVLHEVVHERSTD